MALFSFPDQVNEHAARMVAGCVVLMVGLGFALQQPWILPVVAAGFVLRVGWGPRFDPLARAAMGLAPKFWKPKPVAGPPKRFAQGMGAVFTLAAAGLWIADLVTYDAHYLLAAWAVGAVIVFFAILESAMAFCMGCWIYGRLQRVGVFPADACVDCAPGSAQAGRA
jgi:hypothetical protein